MKGFRERLAERQANAKTLVCVGLDPLAEKMPLCVKTSSFDLATQIFNWMAQIVRATGPYASIFKLQSAHYEAILKGGWIVRALVEQIKENFPDIPVFLDCKRGDIDRTQKQYAKAHFDIQGVDGINFNPYMGKDCMAALVDPQNLGRALVGLCYTSNPDAREIQDIPLGGGALLWHVILEKIFNWAMDLGVIENAGLVMAAAYERPKGSGKIYSEHLEYCRGMIGNKMWFLIPGIGTQGGFIAETVRASYRGPGSIAINSSSGIIFAEDPAASARELRDAINDALPRA